jgi:hypothetical protein
MLDKIGEAEGHALFEQARRRRGRTLLGDRSDRSQPSLGEWRERLGQARHRTGKVAVLVQDEPASAE